MQYASFHDHAQGCKPEFSSVGSARLVVRSFDRQDGCLAKAIAYGTRQGLSEDECKELYAEGRAALVRSLG